MLTCLNLNRKYGCSKLLTLNKKLWIYHSTSLRWDQKALTIPEVPPKRQSSLLCKSNKKRWLFCIVNAVLNHPIHIRNMISSGSSGLFCVTFWRNASSILRCVISVLNSKISTGMLQFDTATDIGNLFAKGKSSVYRN